MSADAASAREGATRQANLALKRHLHTRASTVALEQQRRGRAVVRRITAQALAAADVGACLCGCCITVGCYLVFLTLNFASAETQS